MSLDHDHSSCHALGSRQTSEALGHLTSRAAHSATQKRNSGATLAHGGLAHSPGALRTTPEASGHGPLAWLPAALGC
eukprot:1647117-Alexandrium_andersonii.AAC.1